MEKYPVEPENKPVLITKDMLVSENKIKKDTKNVDLEDNITYLPPLSIILVILNVLVFAWELQIGALTSKESIIQAGALYRPNVLDGEYWRLISVMFLHGGFMHIIGNMVMLYLMGMLFERFFSPTKALLIYLFSGIMGALLSMAISEGPGVGASGAIFGLMGANIYYLFKHRYLMTSVSKRVGTVLVCVAIYSIAQGFMTPFVDNFAHIGGFLGGILFAILMRGKQIAKKQNESNKYPS